MIRFQRAVAIVAATIACGLVSSVATANIILSDAFERTLGNADPNAGTLATDWGSNDNLAAGGAVVQAYATTPTRLTGGGVNSTVQEGNTDGDNEGVIRFGAASTTYNLATDPAVLAGGGYTVDVDITRGPTGFASIFFGLDPSVVSSTDGGAAFLAVNAATDAAFLIQNNGGVGRIQFNTFGGGAINFDNAFADPTAENRFTVTVSAPDGFDSGDVATFSIAANGNLITSQQVTLDGTGAGYIGFSANTGGALYDNLIVRAIPEPSSIVIGCLALGGVTLLRRIR